MESNLLKKAHPRGQMSAGDHLFVEGWTGEDELRLLKAIEDFGYGNWCVSLLFPSELATLTASSHHSAIECMFCRVGVGDRIERSAEGTAS